MYGIKKPKHMNKYNKTETDSENNPVVATGEGTLWEVGVRYCKIGEGD